MTYEDTLALILTNLSGYALAILAIVGSILGIGVGVLVFQWGWKTLWNLPGGTGYDSSKGSGLSRFNPRAQVRNSGGGINLLG